MHVASSAKRWNFSRWLDATPYYGKPGASREVLGWTATTTLEAMCREMVQVDLALFERDAYLQAGGHDVVSPADL